MEDDNFNFAPDEEDTPIEHDTWNILVADDAPDIHLSTKFALHGVEICGKTIQLFDTYSAAETQKFIENDSNNIHLILLDAVMEHSRAGIDCAKYIREDLKKLNIPIIVMRTGFAGWEIESDPKKLSYVDDFVLKSKTSRNLLIELLEKWLLHVSALQQNSK